MCRLAAVAMLALTCGPLGSVPSVRDEVSEQIEKSLRELKAADPLSVLNARQRLYEVARLEDLRQLQTDPDDGVALVAAWGLVRRSVPEAQQRRPIAVDAGSLERFVGFVEGRLRVQIPEPWERAVLSAKAYRRDNIGFAATNEYKMTKAGVQVPIGTSLESRDGDLWLQVDEEFVRLPAGVRKELRAPISCMSALLGPERCYFALHSLLWSPYFVFCTDRKSGTLLWKSEVWAEGGIVQIGGAPGPHSVLMREQQDRILVFGVSGVYAGIEAFNVKDGRNLFRFTAAH